MNLQTINKHIYNTGIKPKSPSEIRLAKRVAKRNEIIKLWSLGFKLKYIAAELNCSMAYVSRLRTEGV